MNVTLLSTCSTTIDHTPYISIVHNCTVAQAALLSGKLKMTVVWAWLTETDCRPVGCFITSHWS